MCANNKVVDASLPDISKSKEVFCLDENEDCEELQKNDQA